MAEGANAYMVVIADLKRRRNEIDRMIGQLEAMAADKPLAADDGGERLRSNSRRAEQKADDHAAPASDGKREFAGMKVADAAKIVMSRRRKPMSPSDITADLRRGGLTVASSNTVASVLHRRSRDVGDVVSPRRGSWALKDRHSHRSTERAAVEDEAPQDDAAPGDGDGLARIREPEQPSWQPPVFSLGSADTT